MKIAGLLLMISGVLMIIAFFLQIPAIYELIKTGSQKAIASRIFYNVLLIAASIFLYLIGRKVRRSRLS